MAYFGGFAGMNGEKNETTFMVMEGLDDGKANGEPVGYLGGKITVKTHVCVL